MSNSTEVWWVQNITRPEICFGVSKVCQYMQKPLDEHWKTIKRILRYLKDTRGLLLKTLKELKYSSLL